MQLPIPSQPSLDSTPIPLPNNLSPLETLTPKSATSKNLRKYPPDKHVQLINEFYENFYSLRNLGIKAWYLVIAFVASVLIALIFLIKFYNPNSFFSNFWILLSYVPVLGLYHNLLNTYEKNILTNYTAIRQTDISDIIKAQEDWLKQTFGEQYCASELIKHFKQWHKYREAYPTHYKFPWGKYIYASDAKARIMGATTALLALAGVLLLNIFKPTAPEPIIEQLIINAIFIGVLSFFVIIPIFFMLLFGRDIIKRLYYSLTNFADKNKFSEDKYQKFMAFLVNQIEIK